MNNKAKEMFWQSYLLIEKEVLQVAETIYFTDVIHSRYNQQLIEQKCDTQLKTFSPKIANLIIRICIEIEAISKELYKNNGGTKYTDDELRFDTDCLQHLDEKYRTSKNC